MTAQRIQRFNEKNKPFYIVDHENGNYSLCLPLNMVGDDYFPYCQEAFDAYAREIGEAPRTASGLFTHGSGYEWQAAFCQAFHEDPNLQRFCFDCENSGFFMYCNDLSLLEEYGGKFRQICENPEAFTPIVSAGIKQMDWWEEEQERKMNTVRGRLMAKPNCTFEIQSPYGNLRITPEDCRRLLAGEMDTVQIDGVRYADFELLDQEVIDSQTDLFDSSLIRMRTEEADIRMYDQMT